MILLNSLGKPFLLALVLLLTVTLGLAGVTTAKAGGPGDLDTTFGLDGIVTTTVGSYLAAGSAVAVQPDGKIVIAGRAVDGTQKNLIVVRYLSNGSLDPSFGITGVVTIPVKQGVYGRTLIIQPDGKIVFASPDLLARFLSNGDLDLNFGHEGKIIAPISVQALTLQSDGKIVAAGDVIGIDGYGDMALARFNHDGSLDSTFNNTGVVTTPLFAQYDGASGVAIQPDGKIVVTAVSYNDGDRDMIVARYHSTGDLDKTFGNAGIVFTPIGSDYSDAAHGVVVSRKGKIIVVGQANYNNFSGAEQAVVRYTEAGSLDSLFSKTGVVTTTIGSAAVGNAVALQRYGKILVVGTSNSNGFPQCTLTRYTGEGTLDASFNGTGIVITGIDDVPGECYSLAVQADGKIVVTGFTYNFDIAVARYLGDPQVSLTQTIDDETPKPGQRITYTVVLSNVSDTDVTGAVISVALPTELILADKAKLDPPQAGVKLAQSPADLPYLAQKVTIKSGQIVTVTVPITITAKSDTLITNTIALTSKEIMLPQTYIFSITVVADPALNIYLPLILKA